MSRFIYFTGLGFVAVALAFVLTHEVLGPTPGPAAARRIKEGMQIEEVEAILGGRRQLLKMFPGQQWSVLTYKWNVAGGVVTVIFIQDRNARPVVIGKAGFTRSTAPGLLDKVASWLGH